jgi:zinc protease
MDLVVVRRPGRLAAVWLWLDAGAVDESDQEAGTAHLLEHMVFKGTSARGLGEAARDVEALGGDLNAFTAHDETVLHATVDAAGWAGALDVIVDLVRSPRIDPGELERERSVVIDEIRTFDDDPDTVVHDGLHAALWKGHPYGRPVLGTVATVARIGAGDLRAFWQAHWSPHRARLIVVGDVDPDNVAARARTLCGSWRRGADRLKPKAPAHLTGPVVKRIAGDFATAEVHVAWRGPPAGHPDGPALDVLAAALGEGQASALWEALHQREELATSPWAEHAPLRDGGSLSIGFLPLEGHTEKATRTAIEVVRNVARKGLGPVDVDRARTRLRYDALFDDETVDGLADRTAWGAARLGDPDAANAWRRAVEGVTPDDIRRVAATWLVPDRFAVSVLDADLTEREVGRLDQAYRRTPRPTRVEGDAHTLHNGVVVSFHPEPGPLAGLAAVALGGGLVADARTAGHGAAWAELLSWGAGELDADAFGRAADATGLDMDALCGRAGVQVAASFPKETAVDALDLIGATLGKPLFDKADVRQIARERLEDLDTLVDRPQEVVTDATFARLFPGHPWMHAPHGTRASLKRLDADAAHRFHAEHIAGRNLHIAVVGALDPERVFASLLPWLDALAERPPPALAATLQKADTSRCTVRAGRAQATVQFAWRGVAWDDPQRDALAVAAHVLGSQSGRLFMELREHRALGYSVWASTWEGPGAGAVHAGLATDPERAQEARDALAAVLAGLKTRPPTDDEIARARRVLVAEAATRNQRIVARATAHAMRLRAGVDAGADALAARLDRVDARRVIEAWEALGTAVEVMALPP